MDTNLGVAISLAAPQRYVLSAFGSVCILALSTETILRGGSDLDLGSYLRHCSAFYLS